MSGDLDSNSEPKEKIYCAHEFVKVPLFDEHLNSKNADSMCL